MNTKSILVGLIIGLSALPLAQAESGGGELQVPTFDYIPSTHVSFDTIKILWSSVEGADFYQFKYSDGITNVRINKSIHPLHGRFFRPKRIAVPGKTERLISFSVRACNEELCSLWSDKHDTLFMNPEADVPVPCNSAPYCPPKANKFDDLESN